MNQNKVWTDAVETILMILIDHYTATTDPNPLPNELLTALMYIREMNPSGPMGQRDHAEQSKPIKFISPSEHAWDESLSRLDF